MNLRPSLAPRQSIGLRLTPALRTGLSLLRMPATDLADELRRAAAENPLIRLAEDAPEGNPGWHGTDTLAAPDPLGERLRRQIALMPLESAVSAIARFLTGDIDDHGYLDPEAQANVEAMGIAPDQVTKAIAALQACDPAGVGARNLEECLALQLRERGFPEAEARAACARLDLLAERRLAELAALTDIDAQKLLEMADALPGLTPRPGDGIGDEPLPPVPEILVEQGPDGQFCAVLDRLALPHAQFDTVLADGLGSAAGRMRDAAQTLIQALRFRERTLEAVAHLILTRQHRFFAEGPEHLLPMTRAEMAGALGLHPSTVGRALADKALAFRGTVHPLSLFVSPALPATGARGVTAYAAQRRIRRLIEAETVDAILSDAEIAELLRQEGVDIARRTVAKYRSCLTIPPSFERRRLKGG
ncbi:RNA polymerase factor sigma-54 [Rhodovulum sp.]|uniref:RNA polymerase factor sigma-54 n=1 Tax=Rhodovulum sp. TaxID=34009 RepID=UPI00182C75A5|nr:RNA polymerase sigma-54 factor [Rhodovulum sp.]HDR28683.1 RNA polymerase sigma-54 factor [Rhodovulum sp.]